ncbi:MAG: hypothetical protein OEZ01_16505 [Candidatus Heimdallarchaeota archaeon]|nr:hypothetical protein [Candidatus Heimdallarchaeota archaeon]MDH5647614.1 hypothetical protein [Candidatus Heimdallarchaeota archaeon]
MQLSKSDFEIKLKGWWRLVYTEVPEYVFRKLQIKFDEDNYPISVYFKYDKPHPSILSLNEFKRLKKVVIYSDILGKDMINQIINNITALPIEVLYLPCIYNYPIKLTPLHQITTLQTLAISVNARQPTAYLANIDKLQNLTRLYLHYYDLQEQNEIHLADNLSKLSNLKQLTLSSSSTTHSAHLERHEEFQLYLRGNSPIRYDKPARLNQVTLNVNIPELEEIIIYEIPVEKLILSPSMKSVKGIVIQDVALLSFPQLIGISTSLHKLIIRGKHFEHIPEEILALETLEYLEISCHELTQIPEGIARLKSLKVLEINSKVIGELPSTITELQSLESLSISGMNLTSLPDSIGNLQSLRNLIIIASKLKCIPDSIGNLKSLKSLTLHVGKSKLPDSIGNLKSLKSFTIIRGGMFPTLPDSIGDLHALEYLEIDTDLSNMPEPITNLKSLKSLTIRGMFMKTLPDSIGNLQSLKSLTLDIGMFTKLPDSIGKLRNLKVLHLESLEFLQLPETIGELTSLQELKIADAYKMYDLPDSFYSLTSLEKLELLNCPNILIKTEIKNLINLTFLDIYTEDDFYCRYLKRKGCRFDPISILELKKLRRFSICSDEYDSQAKELVNQIPKLSIN